MVLAQLNSSGTVAYFNLMQCGYTFNIDFRELFETYKPHLKLAQIHMKPKRFCKILLQSIGFSDKDFKLGATTIFIRPGKSVLLDKLSQSDPAELIVIAQEFQKKCIVLKWHVVMICVKFCISRKCAQTNFNFFFL